jgi:malonyl-ACP O-methyltransferase BioC
MKSTSKIADSFGAAAKTYARHSSVQEASAIQLALKLQKIKASLPQGPVLEIAAGTGIFTQQLAAILPERTLTISDISADMVHVCRSNLKLDAEFKVKDAEQMDEENRYAVIACAFAAQWFDNLSTTFNGIIKALIPGGHFIFSLPTSGSFPQWKEVCEELGLQYSGNILPQAESIEKYCNLRQIDHDLSTEQITANYSSSLLFFRALKGLGAALKLPDGSAKINLESASLLPIISHWDKKSSDTICVTYEVLFGVLRK